MGLNRRDFAVLTFAATLATSSARAQSAPPLVIARGAANGEGPDGTLGAYESAINEGADYIEASLVATKDGMLVARRDNELSASTDVAIRPEFANRKTRKTIDGAVADGWFAEDFTLAELKTLTCGGSAPASILTFQEVVDIARAGSVRATRVIGVCARMVHPGYFTGVGLPLEPRLADIIRTNGYNTPAAAMFVESFEVGALKTISSLTRARRVQLINNQGPPADQPHLGFADMTSADGLRAVRAYAQAIGPSAALLLDPQTAPTALVGLAHSTGLAVLAQTVGTSEAFPPPPFRHGDVRGFILALFATGVDGVTGDSAALAVRARTDAMARLRRQTQKPS